MVTARQCLGTKGEMAAVEKACELNRGEEEDIWLCSDAPGFTQAKRFLPEGKCKMSKASRKNKTGRKVR